MKSRRRSRLQAAVTDSKESSIELRARQDAASGMLEDTQRDGERRARTAAP
jgi:hypothetical protein